MTATKERNFGLDFMRFTAIVLVLIHHWVAFNLTNYAPTAGYAHYFSLFGYYGVEIFFVLSGFLIGNIIIKTFINSSFDLKSIKTFWMRRWLRTLPLYYFALIINLIYALVKKNRLDSLWKYFLFIQNLFQYNTLNKDFFGESWSLTIEEWFYLSFPLLLFLINALLKNRLNKKNILLYTIILYILIPTITRFVIVFTIDPSWNNVLRKAVVCREDSIAFGILGAFINNTYKRSLPVYLKSISMVAGTILLIICGWIFCNDVANDYYYRSGDVSLFSKTILFSMVSFAVLLTMPFFFQFNTKHQLLRTPITFISKISYSIYLTHLFIEHAIHKIFHIDSVLNLIIRLFLFISCTILVSNLTFTFIENKFLLIRDKIWKEKYKAT